jgi:crotonobetainyl-CoA:carnitine CoA-transferase CaiB-like acyl-CoA transferase
MKLQGLRVVDLSQFLPGPLIAMMMADHGAEVIKIENPSAPEPSRRIGPTVDGASVYFRNTQRGKKSVALDLKKPAAREVLLRLCARADVVLESFRPGVADRLGIGARALRAQAPGLVYCSISAFGQQGSWRERPAHDLSVQALAGHLSLGLGGDGAPVNPGTPSADVTSAMTALSAILMALFRRATTGHGDSIDIAMYDSIFAWSTLGLEEVFGRGEAPVPGRMRIFGGAAFYRPYKTKDGKFVTLGGSELKFAENLLNALGRPDLIALAKKPFGPDQAPLRAFLSDVFLTRTRDEWTAWFADKDVCFAPVLDMMEATQHPLATERGMVLRDESGHRHVGPPIKFADEPARPRFALPEVGADSRKVLGDLGYDAAEIAALEAEGAVTTKPASKA